MEKAGEGQEMVSNDVKMHRGGFSMVAQLPANLEGKGFALWWEVKETGLLLK